MMSLQSLKNCRGTAAVDELHVDSVDDMKILSRPVPAVRYIHSNLFGLFSCLSCRSFFCLTSFILSLVGRQLMKRAWSPSAFHNASTRKL